VREGYHAAGEPRGFRTGITLRRTILVLAAMAAALLLASGVALAVTKVGGPGDDVLTGTFRSDQLHGRGGDDTLDGRKAGDELDGDAGADLLYGDDGDDLLDGGMGADLLVGGDGDDSIYDGEDYGGPVDRLFGGAGNDTFFPYNQPAGKDFVYCGGGTDYVFADRADVLNDCERVAFWSGVGSE